MSEITVKNIAVFDAEFTAKTAQDRGAQEMIQCALLIYQVRICDEGQRLLFVEEPIFTYKTFVKPKYNSKLSQYIQELTGIEQADVDGGKLFQDAMETIWQSVNKYDVRHIIIWGPDKMLVKNNCDILGVYNRHARSICGKFYDVSRELSHYLGYNVLLSQHKACELMQIDEIGQRHDAYADAMNLSKIVQECCKSHDTRFIVPL